MVEPVSVPAHNVVDRVERDAHDVFDEPRLKPIRIESRILDESELRFLNEHWTLSVPHEPVRRIGLRAYVRRRAKAVVRALVFPVMRDVLEKLVTMQNKLATRCDVIALEVEQSTEATCEDVARLADRDIVLYERLEERIRRLEAQVFK